MVVEIILKWIKGRGLNLFGSGYGPAVGEDDN